MRAHPAAGRTSPLTPRVTGTPRTPTPTPPPLCPPCPLARPHVPRGWASRVHLVRRHRTFWQVPLTRWLGPFPGMGHSSSGSSIDYLPRQWWEASPSLGFGRPTTHLGAPKAFFELEAVVTPELMVRCQQRTLGTVREQGKSLRAGASQASQDSSLLPCTLNSHGGLHLAVLGAFQQLGPGCTLCKMGIPHTHQGLAV